MSEWLTNDLHLIPGCNFARIKSKYSLILISHWNGRIVERFVVFVVVIVVAVVTVATPSFESNLLK